MTSNVELEWISVKKRGCGDLRRTAWIGSNRLFFGQLVGLVIKVQAAPSTDLRFVTTQKSEDVF